MHVCTYDMQRLGPYEAGLSERREDIPACMHIYLYVHIFIRTTTYIYIIIIYTFMYAYISIYVDIIMHVQGCTFRECDATSLGISGSGRLAQFDLLNAVVWFYVCVFIY